MIAHRVPTRVAASAAVLVAILVALSVTLGVPGAPRDAAAVPPAQPTVPLIYRLVGTEGASKVISVTSTGWGDTTAQVRLWERAPDGVGWRQVAGPWVANVGYGGWATTPGESTGRSPVGSFGFGTGFGMEADPGYRLGWFVVGPTDYWVEDPAAGAAYNTHQIGPANPAFAPWGHFERLADYAAQYRYAALINFNVPVTGAGRGSGIFLHVSTGGPTAGCVALPLGQLLQALRWIDAGTKIVMGPESAVTRGPATAIEAVWWSSPVDLGAPTTPEWPTPTRPGAFRHFERGSIYWSTATGAQEVIGAIRERWASTGWETGLLGFPTTDELPAPDGRGRFNHFEGGSIYWTPTTGAHSVTGTLQTAWAARRWEQGPLGYPTAEAVQDANGRHQRFADGVLFLPTTGALREAYVPTVTSYRGQAVDELYRGALQRAADPGGRAYWVGRLAAGMRFDDVAAAIWASPEAYALAGGTNRSWVAALYQGLLGRSPDDTGWAVWSEVAARDRAGVVRAIYNATESASRRVDAAYWTVLGRAPDASGRAYWMDRIAWLGDAQLLVTIGHTDEAFDRLLRTVGAT